MHKGPVSNHATLQTIAAYAGTADTRKDVKIHILTVSALRFSCIFKYYTETVSDVVLQQFASTLLSIFIHLNYWQRFKDK